jgi:L-lactate dehydrogenase complex protein LldE
VRVALFVPCYVDQLLPRVAWASVALLERLGCEVSFDPAQACCGQPLLTAGDPRGARRLARQWLGVFERAEHVVAPSASCVATVRRHYGHLCEGDARTGTLERVRELCEFAVEVLGVDRIPGRYPHRVGLHPSCHGLRELRLGTGSERAVAHRDPAHQLLSALDGIALVEPARRDECCGFGGVFAVAEPAVSGMMGRDRVAAYRDAGAEVITSTDASCLAHLDGAARRAGFAQRAEGERSPSGGPPLRVAHVAEILAEACT